LVESALCEGPLCNTTSASVAIGANDVIVLSGSSANLSVLSPGGGEPYSFTNGLSLTVEIYDDRMQQMPGGTVVSASLSSNVTGSITSPAPAAWPCSVAPPYVGGSGNVIAGQVFNFTVAATSPVPTGGLVGGTLYISVKTPAGLITTFPIAITP
jgi:hypothetical protein